MQKNSSDNLGRREVLAATIRYAALGAMAAVGGTAFFKRRRLVREGICINDGICRGCGVFEDCGLPRALAAKESSVRSANGGK